MPITERELRVERVGAEAVEPGDRIWTNSAFREVTLSRPSSMLSGRIRLELEEGDYAMVLQPGEPVLRLPAPASAEPAGGDELGVKVLCAQCGTKISDDGRCPTHGVCELEFVADLDGLAELLTSDPAVKAAAAVVMRMEGYRAPTDTARAALEAVAALRDAVDWLRRALEQMAPDEPAPASTGQEATDG